MTDKRGTVTTENERKLEQMNSDFIAALKVYAHAEYVDVKQRGRAVDSQGEEYEDLVIDDDGTIARSVLAKYDLL